MTQQANYSGPTLDLDATRQVLADIEKKRYADIERARHQYDHLRALAPADIAMIRAHLAKHAPQGLPCICGKAAWLIEQTLTSASMVQVIDGQVRLPSRLVPDVALIASCCGERRYISAVEILGLLPPENLPDEMMNAITRRVPLNPKS